MSSDTGDSVVCESSPAPLDLAAVSAEQKAKAELIKAEGNELFAKNKWAAAREKYSQAIDLDSTNPIYFSNRAFCDIKLEEFGSALIDATQAIAIDKTFSKAYYRRGTAHLLLGKYNDAQKDFQTLIKLKPSDKDARDKLELCKKKIYAINFEKAIQQEAQKPPSETINMEDYPIEKSYDGPLYEGPHSLTPQFLSDLLQYFKAQKKLARKCVYQLCLDMSAILKKLPTLIDVAVPANTHITVCGDVHGQFYDVLNIFALNGMPSQDNPYLFNGDFVDRGSFSLEVILSFFAFKIAYPQHFHMMRGNHETINMNSIYGFQGEVDAKVDKSIFHLFTEVFNHLPLAAVLGSKVFVVHGGLFSNDDVTLDDIRAIDRVRQPPDSGLMCELLWSDPQKPKGRAPSKRGVGLSFGPDVTEKFLAKNNLELIIRSHEVKDDGYEKEHNDQLITVFSAPNYCDQMGNKGAYIRFNGGEMKPIITSFSDVPHPPVQPMAYSSMGRGMFM